LTDVLHRKNAIKCQQGITKTGAKIIGDRLKALGACAAGALRCVQSKSGTSGCLAKAAAVCDKKIGALSAATTKHEVAILKHCAVVEIGELQSARGLGYQSVADACASIGADIDSAEGIAECVSRLHACRADQMFGAQLPRAGALIESAGVSSQRLAELACLPRGTDGSGGAGVFAAAIERCAATIRKAGRSFVAAELTALGKCLASTLACEQAKPGGFPPCMQRVGPKCRKALPNLALARGKMATKIQGSCEGLPFDALSAASGVDLDVLTSECAGRGLTLASVTDYAECLVRHHECQVNDLLHVEVPRTEPLFERVGLGGAFPRVACAGSDAESTPTPTPSAPGFPSTTATASATATPTESSTPTASETSTPTETPTPSPTATETPGESPTPTETPTPEATESATPTPEITATPSPTLSATQTPEATGTPTPVATETDTPTPSDTPTETTTPSPEATETAAPTEAASPIETSSPEPTPADTPTPEI
ncbi:MAG: hypothetical protein ABI080_22795, partial [Candidatus Binatia bacterium]